MSINTIDSDNTSKPELDAATTKGKRTSARKCKPAKKAGRAKMPASTPKADRANKKAEVIAMMKRSKGATLAEIMAVTKWQAHKVRGFVSILAAKEGKQSSRPRTLRATAPTASPSKRSPPSPERCSWFQLGRRFLLV